jgi:hypothetical protein
MSMGGHRHTAAVIGVLIAGLALGAGAAGAQEGDPTVQGSVVGTLTQGSRVTFTVTATHPEGWGALRQVNVILTLRDVPLDQLEFHADDQAVSTGGGRALLGTANVATGRFFRIAAVDVGLRTAGKRLVVTMRPRVIAEIPPGARFEFVAEDDFGESVSVGRVAPTAPDEDGGIPWGTAALAVAGALVAGGLVGSRVAAHRRPARSIYATVHRKIEAQPYRRVAEARGPAAAPEPPAQSPAAGRRPTRASARSRSGSGTTRPRRTS